LTGAEDSTGANGGSGLDRALELVRFLRANCSWDRAQTPESLVPYLLEETHEVVDAIHDGDARALEGELGDLLLNLAFQVVLGEEQGRFTASSIATRLEEKMRRRHPHLYGLGEREAWEALKGREREGGGVLDGLARGLDPLTAAHRIQERVSAVGFDWADYRGAFDKVIEELEEVKVALEAAGALSARDAAGAPSAEAMSASPAAEARDASSAPEASRASSAADATDASSAKGASGAPSEQDRTAGSPAAMAALEEELGDLLFATINLVRLAGSHPTSALERANRKFRRRFERLETLARERGVVLVDAGLAELDRLWDELKAEER
jgi:uncharacterized protein YabN with tetrapyrrole methylase and pyrophosphatase domain